MPGISIDHLTLQLPGVSEAQGRRLALGISNGLAAAGLLASPAQISQMRIDLTADAGADADHLAKKVVAEILRQLRQMP